MTTASSPENEWMSHPNLSSAATKKGREQRLVLRVLLEHEAAGQIPTNGRFIFYEMEQAGDARKSGPGDNERFGKGIDVCEQNVINALVFLRDQGIVPWEWIEDETRTLHGFAGESYSEIVAAVNIDPWQGRAPLLLAESRSLGGVLDRLASEYRCSIAAPKRQVRRFLVTAVAPALAATIAPCCTSATAIRRAMTSRRTLGVFWRT